MNDAHWLRTLSSLREKTVLLRVDSNHAGKRPLRWGHPQAWEKLR